MKAAGGIHMKYALTIESVTGNCYVQRHTFANIRSQAREWFCAALSRKIKKQTARVCFFVSASINSAGLYASLTPKQNQVEFYGLSRNLSKTQYFYLSDLWNKRNTIFSGSNQAILPLMLRLCLAHQ